MGSHEAQVLSSRVVRNVSPASEGPAVNIPGIPDQIDWRLVQEFLTSLGIDIKRVSASGVTIGWDNIACDVLAVNADGRHYLDRVTDRTAVHRICIPINHATE